MKKEMEIARTIKSAMWADVHGDRSGYGRLMTKLCGYAGTEYHRYRDPEIREVAGKNGEMLPIWEDETLRRYMTKKDIPMDGYSWTRMMIFFTTVSELGITKPQRKF